jgi:hypothetical protein
MAPKGETYRRLPGRRRSLWSGASLWMGSDHLLLVKSAWFREEYKRFYLRDIQAIVVARGARFYVTTPVLILALLWLVTGLGAAFGPAGFGARWGIAGLAMAAIWLALSTLASCRCRLYTAVSHDELPSLYRIWTARRFLKRVKPRIDQVQGVMAAGWMETEGSLAGPADAPLADAPSPTPAATRSHTLASDLFVLSLFVGALVDLNAVHSHIPAWSRVSTGLSFVQLIGAIAVMIQHYRGTLHSAMHKVAVADLVLMGAMLYVQALSLSLAGVDEFRLNGASLPLSWLAVAHQAVDGLGLLLGFLGAAIILRGRSQPDIIKS